jgi:hypothetical protein
MEPTTEPRRQAGRESWLSGLFLTLALLYLIPFWSVHYLPTVDGPCHTYNAWILRQHANPAQYPLFQQYYEVNAVPYPNWIGHGIMAGLMFVVPPLVAEKLLVSAYALTFLAGMWYLAGSVRPESRWLAFLAFPFVFNFMFQFGFYNFSISLALFPLVLGFWWRHREHPLDAGFMIGINLLLWLCYFSHILSFGLSLLAIAVLWLAALRRDNWRRHRWHVPILAPQIVLPIWYFSREGGATLASYWPFGRLAGYFIAIGALPVFGEAQRWLAGFLAAAFLILLVLTLGRVRWRRPWQEEHAFLLLAVLFTLLYFVSPEGMSGGTMLKNRLCLYPYLVLVPWLAPGLGERARRTGVAALTVVALLDLRIVAHGYRVLSGDMERYLAGLAPVRPGTRVLPVLFPHDTDGAAVDVLGHAMSYAALERGLVDWDNYEAASTFFPVRFADAVPWPPISDIEARPERLRLRRWRRADYVYTWRLPPDHPFGIRLRNSYQQVAALNDGVLWARKGDGAPPPMEAP